MAGDPLRSLLAAGVAAVLLLPSPASAGDPPPGGDGPGRGVPPDRPGRGLVYAGLRADPDGVCEGAFRLAVEVPGPPLCTHGPDPAPAGVKIGEHQVATDADPTLTTAESGGDEVPCIGDGVSGPRVEAIYAVASDVPDRYDAVVSSIRQWAADVNATIAVSANRAGGTRSVRFVTEPTDGGGCRATVTKAVLPPHGDDDLGKTVEELTALGFADASRKYLIWMDASVYCGIAGMYLDDRPGQENYNNGAAPMYARTDSGCWGGYDPATSSLSVEAHELVHTLGGVQDSAPHATGNGHCTDDHDLMCYDDDGAGPVTMAQVCSASEEPYLDCNHDDYFHTHPPDGSYLSDHWNTASSSFLADEGTLGSAPSPSSPKHARTVRLTRLTAKLVVKGAVEVDDGFARCRKRVPVRLQRKKTAGWRSVARGKTGLKGRFGLQLPSRPGKYRVIAPKKVLEVGDVCKRAVSDRTITLR